METRYVALKVKAERRLRLVLEYKYGCRGHSSPYSPKISYKKPLHSLTMEFPDVKSLPQPSDCSNLKSEAPDSNVRECGWFMTQLLKPPPPANKGCVCVAVCKDERMVRKVRTDKVYKTLDGDDEMHRYYIDETEEYFFSVYGLPERAYEEYLRWTDYYETEAGVTVLRDERKRAVIGYFGYTLRTDDGDAERKPLYWYKIKESGLLFTAETEDIYEAYIEWRDRRLEDVCDSDGPSDADAVKDSESETSY